jgi:hypothetical protein
MKFGRLSGVPIAVSILATLGFAQLTNPTETSNAATELPVKYKFDGKAKLKVTLRIYDFAEIDPAVLAAARKVTTEIFREGRWRQPGSIVPFPRQIAIRKGRDPSSGSESFRRPLRRT